MYRVAVVVEGTGRGLLMHRFSPEGQADLDRTVKKAGRVHSAPEIEAEQAAYRLDKADGQDKGQLCLPATHFLGGLTAAAAGLQVKGRGKKSYKGAFQGNVEVLPDFIGLTDEKDQPVFQYAIHSEPVRIQKGRVMRHRPHFKAWRMAFTIEVLDKDIPIEVVQAALDEAGRSKCVGDHRPRYGQFRIAKFERMEEGQAVAA